NNPGFDDRVEYLFDRLHLPTNLKQRPNFPRFVDRIRLFSIAKPWFRRSRLIGFAGSVRDGWISGFYRQIQNLLEIARPSPDWKPWTLLRDRFPVSVCTALSA